MSTFGKDLIQSLNEALDHAKGEGPAILHAPVPARGSRACKPHTGADGTIDGYEPFWLSQMGAGHAPGQRPRRNSSACDRKGAGSGQACIAGSRLG